MGENVIKKRQRETIKKKDDKPGKYLIKNLSNGIFNLICDSNLKRKHIITGRFRITSFDNGIKEIKMIRKRIFLSFQNTKRLNNKFKQ